MPYIKPADRDRLDPALRMLGEGIFTVGELNYAITRLVHIFLARGKINYTALNAAVGVLSCAKTEIERRMVAPYEDQKIAENGDLPPIGEGR